MKTFVIVWSGQLLSLIGSGLTGFALSIWIYEQNHSVVQFAFATVFSALTSFLISPVAGVFVDRWNRRLVMISSDLIASIVSLVLLFLSLSHHLAIWHVYIADICFALGEAFQVPAQLATIPLLVPKNKLNWASGMIELATGASELLSPLLGGIALSLISLEGIIALDLSTFIIAQVTLFIVRIPNVPLSEASQPQSNVFQSLIEGWRYLSSRKGLLNLMLFDMGIEFLMGIVLVLFTPLVLSITNTSVLGIILSLSGIGVFLGGIIQGLREEVNNQIKAIFIFTLLGGFSILMVGLKASIYVYGLAVLIFMSSMTIVGAANQVILQKKTAPAVQGRIFSLQMTGTMGATTLAAPIGGLLADHVFEPLMQSPSILTTVLGKMIGTGEGRGISLMFLIIGIMTFILTLIAWQNPQLKSVETQIPDWDHA